MVIDAALGGAVITAGFGILAAIIAKLRCRFLVNNQSAEGLDWNFACGFTEIRLPPPIVRRLKPFHCKGIRCMLKRAIRMDIRRYIRPPVREHECIPSSNRSPSP